MMRNHSKACENAKHDKCRCKCNKKYHGTSKHSLSNSHSLLQWLKC
jgi:hypothetical protein